MPQEVTQKQSVGELLRENEELRRRLQELEETLQAIRLGEVDAFVISGPNGEQIYTLEGADRPYRLLVEEMQVGAATVEPDGLILYVNQQLANMLGVPASKLVGRSLFEFLGDGSKQGLKRMLANARKEKGRSNVILANATGAPIHVSISASSLGTDEQPVISLVIKDRREEKEREEASRLVENFALGVSQATSISAALERMLHQVHDVAGWQFGEAWLPRKDRKILESASAWFCESPDLESIRAASVEAWLPPGIGFPGRAWIAKQPVWIKDLAKDKGYFGVAAAREAGLQAGVAIPVMAMDQDCIVEELVVGCEFSCRRAWADIN